VAWGERGLSYIPAEPWEEMNEAEKEWEMPVVLLESSIEMQTTHSIHC
jgi:hypothetical protein